MTHWKPRHEHVPLANGRAKAAQTYPDALCRAICRVIVQQLQADRQGKFTLVALSMSSAAEAYNERADVLQQVTFAEEEDHPDLEAAYDDVSGAPLGPDMVYRARLE